MKECKENNCKECYWCVRNEDKMFCMNKNNVVSNDTEICDKFINKCSICHKRMKRIVMWFGGKRLCKDCLIEKLMQEIMSLNSKLKFSEMSFELLEEENERLKGVIKEYENT